MASTKVLTKKGAITTDPFIKVRTPPISRKYKLMYEEMPPVEAFAAWLKGWRDEEPVGEKKKACRCPLANWLNEMVGNAPPGRNNFRVNKDRITGRTQYGEIVNWKHTEWSANFVRRVDLTHAVQITAKRARECLIYARMTATKREG
jgi:hypothetical protein